jgi:hypothetical protein
LLVFCLSCVVETLVYCLMNFTFFFWRISKHLWLVSCEVFECTTCFRENNQIECSCNWLMCCDCFSSISSIRARHWSRSTNSSRTHLPRARVCWFIRWMEIHVRPVWWWVFSCCDFDGMLMKKKIT